MLEADSFSSMTPSGPCSMPLGWAEPLAAQSRTTSDTSYVSAGRYGEGRKARMPAILIAIAVHVLVGAALASMGYHVVRHRAESLVAVNLASPPPPDPSKPAPPESQTLQTSVQPATVTIASPIPRPVIAMVPTSSPQVPVAAIAAPPAPVASPPPAPPSAPSMVAADALGTRMISGSPPRYPVESRRKKEQGTVELALVLGLDGRVETISVAGSSGFARLDQAALDAVRRWRWAPTLRDGVPVKVRGTVEIPFVLSNV
ncbi:MAG: energy transducer TonB [Blastomonas sp.]